MNQTDFINLIRKNNLKLTKTRLTLLNFLLSSKKPVSVLQIVKSLNIDQVTAYRTINTFKEKGIVRQVSFEDKTAYFELEDKVKGIMYGKVKLKFHPLSYDFYLNCNSEDSLSLDYLNLKYLCIHLDPKED